MGSNRALPKNAALILIDIQQGFDEPRWGPRNNSFARVSGNLEFETAVAADACAAHDQTGYDDEHYRAAQVHEFVHAHLHGEFAEVADTDAILRALQA